ncbi:ribosomal-protein-alanine N-acetyltransferase [Nocardioides dongxiaopingii]|uniref:ribosomal protein S18-alanine N-acetyltransferase n=1 Tax=Nocardioides sp. S-1144 TaxID=2582905 RepID=UPI00110D3765|nr:ribosomal protein S18-alanine N-acetyltransferase [Nocardioides sp. S-1144]QCW50115.1 ribosomal-protein-alanine N-acetyltransferase [Nocardioides sp. S-1144]
MSPAGPASAPTIRVAGPDDAAAVADLEAENLGGDAWPFGLVAAGVAGEAPTVTYLVADLDGVVVGYAAASVVADIAELQRVAVTPRHRRAGVAGLLLDGVVALARSGGADRVLLEVREDNEAALGFYAQRGFGEIDRRRRYYRDGATAVVMLLPVDR